MQTSPEKRAAAVKLGSKQYGVLSRGQLTKIGLSKSAISRLLAGGRLESLHPGVFRIAGTPATWEQQLIAACLWAGGDAFASHRSAAALFSLEGIRRDTIELTIVGTSSKSRPGVIVHRSRGSLAGQTRSAKMIPVTEVTRTLLDLGAVVPLEIVEVALDDALRRGLVSVDSLARRLNKIGGMGRPGSRAFRGLLQERSEGAISDSTLETRIGRILRRNKLVPPKNLYNVFEKGVFIAEVDYAWPLIKLAIECDSRRFHTGRRYFEDLRRLNRLTEAGWEVLHATWRDVEDDGASLIPQLMQLLKKRSLEVAFGSTLSH